MSLDILERHALAIELLSLGARIKIITEETGISPKVLRKAYFDMHQKSPPSGALKFSPNFIYKSLAKTKEATLFIFFYRIEKHEDFSRRCIDAYKHYEAHITTIKNKPILDISDSWMLAKWASIGILKLVRCEQCRSAKLIVINNNDQQNNVCCVCRNSVSRQPYYA